MNFPAAPKLSQVSAFGQTNIARQAALFVAVLVVTSELLSLAFPGRLPAVVAPAVLGAYFLITLPRQRRMAVGFGLLVTAIVLSEGQEDVQAALQSSLFIMSLFLALSLMAASASRSPDTATISRSIMARPVSRTYLPLALATHLFAIALNVGSVAIFMALLGARSQELADRGQLRPLALAVMRGFASMPLWAPFALSVAITLSLLPDLHYLDLLPFGLGMAVLSIVTGWYIDGRMASASVSEPDPKAVWAMLRLLLRIFVLTGAAWLIEWSAGLHFVEAILIATLVGGLIWWSTTRAPRAGGGTVVPRRRGPGPENEIVIIGAAAFLGKWLAGTVGGSLQVDGLPLEVSAALVSLLPLLMLAGGLLGANPIISSSLLGGLLVPLVTPEQHLYLAIALLGGWGCTASGSPFTGNVLLGSRLIHRSSFVLAIRWNGLFTLGSALTIGLALLLAQLL